MFERSEGRSRLRVRAGRVAAAMVCGGLCLGGVSAARTATTPRAGTDEARGVRTLAGHQAKRKARDVRTAATTRAIRRSSRAEKQKEIPAGIPGPETDIVGGTVAPAGAYPFFVSVKRASDNFAFCGATLVSSVWVLTAAHCVDGGRTAASLKLVIGANQLNDEAPGDVRSVTAITSTRRGTRRRSTTTSRCCA